MRIQPTQAISMAVLGALLLLGAGPGWALTPTEVAKLIASDGAAADQFGDVCEGAMRLARSTHVAWNSNGLRPQTLTS